MGQDLGAKTYGMDCKMTKTYEKIIFVFVITLDKIWEDSYYFFWVGVLQSLTTRPQSTIQP